MSDNFINRPIKEILRGLATDFVGRRKIYTRTREQFSKDHRTRRISSKRMSDCRQPLLIRNVKVRPRSGYSRRHSTIKSTLSNQGDTDDDKFLLRIDIPKSLCHEGGFYRQSWFSWSDELCLLFDGTVQEKGEMGWATTLPTARRVVRVDGRARLVETEKDYHEAIFEEATEGIIQTRVLRRSGDQLRCSGTFRFRWSAFYFARQGWPRWRRFR